MSDYVFSNVIDKEHLRDNSRKAFVNLDLILTDHSGPFATNAIIGSKWRQVNDVDEFSKDGIKILLHLIVSEDPCERMAARMARFVGLRVDSRCHDGTTTAMLTFCRLACIALEYMDSSLSAERYMWTKYLEETLNFCLTEIEKIKITEDDLLAYCHQQGIETTIEEVRASIAYHMAMISSKGDHDLATKISYVIRSSPKKIYGMFKDIPLAIETEEKYLLEKQEFDLSINANLGNIADYNYRSDTQYLSEDAVIFSTANEVIKGSWEAMFLTAFISSKANKRIGLTEFGECQGWEAYHGDKKNLVILSPNLGDSELIQEITDFNNKHPNHKIVYFNTQCHPRMRTSLNKTLHYMAGSYIFQDVMTSDPTLSLIGLNGPSIRVHLIGYVLTLSHLYEKDGEVFHPFYRDPELFPPYTEFAKETEELIQFAKDNITNQALDQDEVTYLISLYRALTCQDIYDIKIGGSSHDQYANRTVYEDAIGAALSAVNEGVVLGGYGHLYRSLRQSDSSYSNLHSRFADTFLSIVEDSLRHNPDSSYVHDQLLKLSDKWHYLSAEPSRYHVDCLPDAYIKLGNLACDLNHFLSRNEGFTILFQSFGGFHEQLKRCRDILPRLSNSTHLVDMRVKQEDLANVR